MHLTPKQVLVLENLDRVGPIPFKTTQTDFPRYQLDGDECTRQVTSLLVKKLISRAGYSRLMRRAA